MEVEKAIQSDAQSIARIHRKSRAKAMPWLPVLHSPEEDFSFFSNRVLPNENVWVARMDSQIAGFCAFQGNGLNHLYIDPVFWRKGIGSALLGVAKKSTPELQLWVFQGNETARHFYALHGFKECEQTDGQKNEEKCPDLRMVWTALSQ